MLKSLQTRLANLLAQDAIAALLLLAPALIILGVFLFWPIAYLIYLSFTQGSFTVDGVQWIGLRNYQRLFVDADFWQVMSNTVVFTIATVIPCLVIPLALAVWLKGPVLFRDSWRALYFIPSITSMVAAGLGFRWLFQNNGPVNGFLEYLGFDAIPWLNSPTWAMPILILLSVWKQLGFNLVVFLAGLQTIPQSHYEAAELDGANSWNQFWHITLPGLQPTLVFAVVTTTIFTLRSFEQIYVITGGGPLNSTNILVYYVYEQAFARFEFGYGAAAATVLLGLAALAVSLLLRSWRVSDPEV